MIFRDIYTRLKAISIEDSVQLLCERKTGKFNILCNYCNNVIKRDVPPLLESANVPLICPNCGEQLKHTEMERSFMCEFERQEILNSASKKLKEQQIDLYEVRDNAKQE